MLWHDAMFACACYPADKKFLENVAAEIRYQTRRLSNHPCIVLWCANNENEEGLFWYDEVQKNRDRYVVDYARLYYDTIQRVIEEEDPFKPFWPSSPSNGVQEWGNCRAQNRGDIHYWGAKNCIT